VQITMKTDTSASC